MKRLKAYIAGMNPHSETYEEMYEGKMYENFSDKDPVVHNHALYWDGEIGYEITKSNRLELSKPTVTIHIPMKLLKATEETTVVLDYIFRSFLPYIRVLNELNDNRKRPAKENGHYDIYEPNHKVLVRNVVSVNVVAQKYYKIVSNYRPGKNCIIAPIDVENEESAYRCVSIMMQVQLPEGKRKKAIQMLTSNLPEAVNCFVEEFDRGGLARAMALYEKQEAIRAWLREKGYCAFVGNGSILPREKDGEDPLASAVPFISTPEDEMEIAGIKGMVFKKGVTVITGGGYSGKSTLLDALSAGIYNHIAGDGREFVITDDSSVKISAEDGRCIRHANLSPFIKWIPGGDPKDFSTQHASGSTSQAANIMEAVNWGAKLLMIDEDKSATNFMIQDAVMKTLIDKEPITPFVERVQELAHKKEVSSILVIGGSSEYLQAADRIYMMQDYRIGQVTKEAKALREASVLLPAKATFRGPKPADFSNCDEIDANYLSSRPEGMSTEVLKVSDLGFLILGEEFIDIRMIHNIISPAQLNAIAFLLRKLICQLNPLERFQKFSLSKPAASENTSPSEIKQEEETLQPKWICRKAQVERLLAQIDEEGLESAYSPFFTECIRWMELPRKYEILAVLSRMRLKGSDSGDAQVVAQAGVEFDLVKEGYKSTDKV